MNTRMDRKVNIRLPKKALDFLDIGVNDGIFATRSDGIRSVITAFLSLTGPDSELVARFFSYILEHPSEVQLFLKYRRELSEGAAGMAHIEMAVKNGMEAEPTEELREILATLRRESP